MAILRSHFAKGAIEDFFLITSIEVAMKINNAGLDLIKECEGLSLRSYLCPAGIPTIGYGHTKKVRLGQAITQVEASQLLQEDIAETEKAIANWAANLHIALNENEFAALVSFCFNIGIGNFAGSTTAKELTKAKKLGDNRIEAANGLLLWNKGDDTAVLPGLVKRRKAEKGLFLKKVSRL